jgi:hypothetical protein
LLVLGVGCSSAATAVDDDPDGASPPAASTTKDAGASTPTPPPSTGDAGGTTDDGGSDAGYPLTYRNSLSVCWTEPACNRAFAVAHGGDWDLLKPNPPYLSNAALNAAYDHGADGIKIDGRITSDGVVVLSHSSPIEYFESLDCAGKKIEEMTVADVQSCHRLASQETYQRLDDVLNAFRGKLVVQICVKRKEDTAGIAKAVLDLDAEDFAFLELNAADIPEVVPSIPNGDKLWYLAQVNQPSDVDLLLSTINSPRNFMYEFEPNDATVATLATTKLHPAGIKTFTYNKTTTSVDQVKGFYTTGGFDVVSTNSVGYMVDARKAINTSRGVSPP